MEENKELEKETIIGDFKPKRKFLNFVSAVQGARVRLLRNVAYVDASKLSGMLEGVKLKLTICDEGTINFEEVETSKTDKEMLVRLIDEIDSRDVTGYAQKFVISGLEFKDEDGSRCYLEVEHEKPVEKFRSILDMFEEENSNIESSTQSLSEKGRSLLESLFSEESEESDFDEDHAQDLILNNIVSEFTEEELNEVVEETTISKSFIEEQFEKMNLQKVNELKSRIEDCQRDINKYEYEFKVADKKVNELKDNLKVLNSRLEQIYPGDEPNGYVFFVSEEQKSEIGLEERDKELVSKISGLMGLKKEALFEHLTEGFYNIKFAKTDDITNQDFELEKEIFDKIKSIDLSGKIVVKDGQFEYRGELNWHQLVQKMICAGFEQSPEFDKLCNSNSYESKWVESDKNKVDVKDLDSDSEDLDSSSEFYAEDFKTFTEPTDLVFVGTGEYNEDGDIMITDDYSQFGVFVNGVEHKLSGYESDGYVTIMTIDEYNNWYAQAKSDIGDMKDSGIEGFFVSGFKGTIQVGAKLEDGGYVKNIDFSDFIQHQFDDCYDVFINLPEGSEIYELNDDLTLPISVIRDIKIDKIINEDMKNKILTNDQLETVEYYKSKFNLDITKNWFIFDTQSDDPDFLDFTGFKFFVTIQPERGWDQDPFCEDFLPDSIESDLENYTECVFGYSGDFSETEFIEVMNNSPFFTYDNY